MFTGIVTAIGTIRETATPHVRSEEEFHRILAEKTIPADAETFGGGRQGQRQSSLRVCREIERNPLLNGEGIRSKIRRSLRLEARPIIGPVVDPLASSFNKSPTQRCCRINAREARAIYDANFVRNCSNQPFYRAISFYIRLSTTRISLHQDVELFLPARRAHRDCKQDSAPYFSGTNRVYSSDEAVKHPECISLERQLLRRSHSRAR